MALTPEQSHLLYEIEYAKYEGNSLAVGEEDLVVWLFEHGWTITPPEDFTPHRFFIGTVEPRAKEGMTMAPIELTVEQATALKDALEGYMRNCDSTKAPTYEACRRLWNAADIALVPLRGGPYSNENRQTVFAPPPAWAEGGADLWALSEAGELADPNG